VTAQYETALSVRGCTSREHSPVSRNIYVLSIDGGGEPRGARGARGGRGGAEEEEAVDLYISPIEQGKRAILLSLGLRCGEDDGIKYTSYQIGNRY
jgi:hypothetical protein